MPLRQWGIALSHAPFLVSLWRIFLSWPPASSFCLASSAISKCFYYFLAPELDWHTHALWPTYLRAEPPRIESTSSPLATLEVFYALSTDSRGYGMTKPPCLTLWTKMFRKSALISSSPNSAGKNVFLRASSIGPIRVPTPGTVLCRYCHSSCNDIPKLA